MRRIAIVNQKGGVGKTTTTVNLAAALAVAKRKVLILDLDPQHSASTWYQAIQQGRGTYDLFMDPAADVSGLIMKTAIAGVSIIPSSPLMYNVDHALAGEPGAEQLLKLKLQKLASKRLDYLLIDCPPSLGLLTINALTAVDEVLVPLEAHVLGLHGLDKLAQTITVVRKRLNPAIRITGIVACRVKPRTRHSQEVLNDIRVRFPDQLLGTIIRENVRLTECPSQGIPITSYAPTSHGAEDYQSLAEEMIMRERKMIRAQG